MLAYNEEGINYFLNPRIIKTNTGDILHFLGPISYYLTDVLKWPLDSNKELRIDIGGRNFGCNSSVCIKLQDIKDFLIDEKII